MSLFSSLVAPVTYRHLFFLFVFFGVPMHAENIYDNCKAWEPEWLAVTNCVTGQIWHYFGSDGWSYCILKCDATYFVGQVLMFFSSLPLTSFFAWRWRQNVTAECWYLSIYRTTHHNLKVFATKLNDIPSICRVFESGTWRFNVKSLNKFYIIFPQSLVALLHWECQYC
jgi:hypothetical protein